MPYMQVCKSTSDKLIHIPNETNVSKTKCGLIATEHHRAGEGGRFYTWKQICEKCQKLKAK